MQKSQNFLQNIYWRKINWENYNKFSSYSWLMKSTLIEKIWSNKTTPWILCFTAGSLAARNTAIEQVILIIVHWSGHFGERSKGDVRIDGYSSVYQLRLWAAKRHYWWRNWQETNYHFCWTVYPHIWRLRILTCGVTWYRSGVELKMTCWNW